MKVVIAGGGTAGHVFPALALAEVLVEDLGAEVSFLGTATGLEGRLVPQAGFSLTPVRAAPFTRELSFATAQAPFTALRSVSDCLPLVRSADAVVGFGGYVSAPAVLAAARTRRPIALHEQNATAGMANRMLSRFATVVALSFDEARTSLPRSVTAVVTGNPVRSQIRDVPRDRSALLARARAELGLDPERTTVLVFGGSQGALRIDQAVASVVDLLRSRADLQFLVLTGAAHHDVVSEAAGDPGGLRVVALPFLDRMELAYAAADLVVARAGATTIAELTVCGLPALLIPYPHATGKHQDANALALQRAGGAAILVDEDLTGSFLAARLRELLDDPERLATMARRSAVFGRPGAARALADEVIRIAERAA